MENPKSKLNGRTQPNCTEVSESDANEEVKSGGEQSTAERVLEVIQKHVPQGTALECPIWLSQKLLQQFVYDLWRVLLHPVGYARQPFHSQISNVALSAVQADRVQRHVPVAPYYQGRHIDYLC